MAPDKARRSTMASQKQVPLDALRVHASAFVAAFRSRLMKGVTLLCGQA